ncbi:hypothetical protein LAZ67_5002806 [Cordylochernes scorpioides]|uniref:Transposase n=1 Tax=Cordylochernes scorpioides TaxID=51811 RepID=A0ABY6KHV7_9ARAC|nr:hypothetical protein LAZ67_5002806 [Cordylochernes scorpioides]
MFSEGREDVNDEERAGRPSTSTTDEKINEVEKMILANRRITVREVAEDLNISIGSCHSIFINDLGMRRVAAKFVPKLLNCDQKQHRMIIANEMLDSVRDDPNLLQRVITGDEVWVYGYDVDTKAQSSQWKLPHEPRPKKARRVRSNVKVLLTVFFDCRGVVHHEFLPQSRTVNKEYYLQVMRNFREAIRQKRPDLWKNKNWLLHHDNAPAHTSLLVRDFLAKNNTLMMPQPPYSPDLAPCDFFLFPKLKRPMKGRRYATLDEIKTASKEELKKILKNDFLKCFEDWKNRWHKCIISHGDYFEGDKIAGIEQNPGPKMSKQTTLETSLDRDKDIKDLINALTKRLDSWGERLESRLSAIDDRVENINQRLQQLEESSAVTKAALSQNSKKIKDLEDQLEHLDAKSRERNLIFYGIEQDNNEDCRERIRKVIEENMQTTEKINITRCHRLSRKPGAPILIEVPEQNDRLTLFKAALNLRGTKISLSKDYSMKMREQRRVLNVKRRELVEKGTLAKLRDDKLLINGIAYKVCDGQIVDANGHSL